MTGNEYRAVEIGREFFVSCRDIKEARGKKSLRLTRREVNTDIDCCNIWWTANQPNEHARGNGEQNLTDIHLHLHPTLTSDLREADQSNMLIQR